MCAANGTGRPRGSIEPLAPGEAYRVIHGNSLAELDRLDDESIDGLITDPPYSSGSLFSSGRRVPPAVKYQSHGAKSLYETFLGETRDQRGYFRWVAWWLSEAWRVCKWGAPACVFSDWRQLPLITDALQVADWTWRGIAVWDKTESCRPQIGRFASQAEYIVWGSKGDMPRQRGVGALPGVFRVPVKPSEKLHMAGKPVALMQQLVKIVAPGGLILDPFAGSGTVGVSALQTDRRYIGIEMYAPTAELCREHLAAASENRTFHETRSAQLGLFAKKNAS